jgi:hypothetical protein
MLTPSTVFILFMVLVSHLGYYLKVTLYPRGAEHTLKSLFIWHSAQLLFSSRNPQPRIFQFLIHFFNEEGLKPQPHARRVEARSPRAGLLLLEHGQMRMVSSQPNAKNGVSAMKLSLIALAVAFTLALTGFQGSANAQASSDTSGTVAGQYLWEDDASFHLTSLPPGGT